MNPDPIASARAEVHRLHTLYYWEVTVGEVEAAYGEAMYEQERETR